MNRRTMRTAAACVLTAGLASGCESSPPRTAYADNPLLQARQPLVQPDGATAADASQIAQSGPRIVVVPPPGLYQQPPAGFATSRPADQPPPAPAPTDTPLARETGPALPPATLTSAAVSPPVELPMPMPTPMPTPLPAAPAVEPATVVPAVAPAADIGTPQVAQVAVRTTEGRFGHAADYTWLQGELDRHYRGHLELRYRPVSEDDPYGGKVRLEDDPLLADFRPGDVIAVEGELLTDPDGPAAAPWAQYKRYHVRAVRLVERK